MREDTVGEVRLSRRINASRAYGAHYLHENAVKPYHPVYSCQKVQHDTRQSGKARAGRNGRNIRGYVMPFRVNWRKFVIFYIYLKYTFI